MGDMLRRAYGDETPNYYINPSDYYINPFGEREVKEGTMIEYADAFPSADDMRRRQRKMSVADRLVIDEIASLLTSTVYNDNFIIYESSVSPPVTSYLQDKGYTINRIRRCDITQTMISW